MSERYNARTVEPKWQKTWETSQAFLTPAKNEKPDYFVLEMFPYPSGNIHMGHVRNYTLGDVVARFKRAGGYNVLYPMGWDAFGLPAENAAIERGVHPENWTLQNIATMREQLKIIGLSYDWSREVTTCLPEYYQHEQRFFLKMLERGIAYRKEAEVNWDPVDNTVLANEQVVDGCGWRSGAPVERRTLSQWFLRISDYAEELLSGLEGLSGWPEKVRIMQEKWIGKSSGALVSLHLAQGTTSSTKFTSIDIYTTRPDTFYGMSFVAMAASHPISKELAQTNADVAAFIKSCEALGTSEEAIEKAEKLGFDTGIKVINPFSGEKVPLFIANFVLMDYGTGAVFGCPAHDARDYEFATKYNLPILQVVEANNLEDSAQLPYTGEGVLINSPEFNGLNVADAKEKAITLLEEKKAGARKINYRLRDWGISRQRYWGCPIPIIYCDDCGAVPVPEDQLPVTLPKDVSFDAPGNPLARHPSWKHVDCPKCGKAATRETDTFDTFFESSWYYAGFASGGGDKGIIASEAERWLPVHQYIGGIEHAVLHLLYARFFARALSDCAVMNLREPFAGLMTQGMVCHATFKDASGNWVYPSDVATNAQGNLALSDGTAVKQGRSEKMSKSKKNTVDPRQMIEAYGADTARLFMMSDSPPDRDLEWTDGGIEGAWRYVQRFYRLAQRASKAPRAANAHMPPSDCIRLMHKTIHHVTHDVEQFHFNKAVARIREFTNALEKCNDDAPELHACMVIATQLIAPFMPHLAEECWGMLGGTGLVCEAAWPKENPEFLVENTVTIAVQINGKLRATIDMPPDAPRELMEKAALEAPKIQEFLGDATLKKVIVVPGKIVNLVAA